jgi:hypothetical protein
MAPARQRRPHHRPRLAGQPRDRGHRPASRRHARGARRPSRKWRHRRQRLRRDRRPRPGGSAQRPPLHHPPRHPRRARQALPESDGRPRRALRHRRPGRHLRRDRQRHRPGLVPDRCPRRRGHRRAGRPRDGRLRPPQRGRAAGQRHAAAPQPPQRDRAPRPGSHRGAIRRPAAARGDRQQVRRKRAYPHPQVHQGDWPDPAALPAATTAGARRAPDRPRCHRRGRRPHRRLPGRPHAPPPPRP